MAKSIHRAEYDVFRALLREKRVASGLTQVDVSLRMGRSQSFVSDVERGVRRVDVLELRDLCGLFGIRLIKFCEDLEHRIATPSSTAQSMNRRGRRTAGVPRIRSSKRGVRQP